jgi:chromosome partitioning protein
VHVIAFTTQKGGSGKSSLAASIAAAACERGKRVFILELDRQGTGRNKARNPSLTSRASATRAAICAPAQRLSGPYRGVPFPGREHGSNEFQTAHLLIASK